MHKRTLLTALLLVALAAIVAATATAAAKRQTATKKANSAVQIEVFSPRNGDIAGKQSKGFFVDLASYSGLNLGPEQLPIGLALDRCGGLPERLSHAQQQLERRVVSANVIHGERYLEFCGSAGPARGNIRLLQARQKPHAARSQTVRHGLRHSTHRSTEETANPLLRDVPGETPAVGQPPAGRSGIPNYNPTPQG